MTESNAGFEEVGDIIADRANTRKHDHSHEPPTEQNAAKILAVVHLEKVEPSTGAGKFFQLDSLMYELKFCLHFFIFWISHTMHSHEDVH